MIGDMYLLFELLHSIAEYMSNISQMLVVTIAWLCADIGLLEDSSGDTEGQFPTNWTLYRSIAENSKGTMTCLKEWTFTYFGNEGKGHCLF